MPNEEERAFMCERLAAKFDRAAAKDDSRAHEFRLWAVQRLRQAEEHPQAADVRTRAEELMREVAYWAERAAWDREMAG